MLKNFRFLTSGESHGKCLNGILDGIPSGLTIDIEFINSELKRRQSGAGRGGRMKIEEDKVEIKSGVRFGKTTGAPICLEIKNRDYENWQKILSISPEDKTDEKSFTQPRPGHADFAGSIKYNLKDLRDVLERSSARKTAIDVAIGAVAKLFLKEFGIDCKSQITEFGGVKNINGEDFDQKIAEKIEFARQNGDTIGGKFEIIYKNLPIGLGSHVQSDRNLDGIIAQNVMSIQAVKSVEIGMGSDVSKYHRSKVHDEIFGNNDKIFRKTNNAGGIEGGMTNGEDLIVKACMKPIPTMKKPLATVDLKNLAQASAHFERSDVSAVFACSVVAEARIATVITDEILSKFGQDNMAEIKRNYFNTVGK